MHEHDNYQWSFDLLYKEFGKHQVQDELIFFYYNGWKITYCPTCGFIKASKDKVVLFPIFFKNDLFQDKLLEFITTIKTS